MVLLVERKRKNIKIGVGIFLIIIAVLNISTEKLPYNQFMDQQIVTLAYIIVGILIILGTGKLKEILRIGNNGK